MSKTTRCSCITLFITLLWRSLHVYDVRPPNAMFYGGCEHPTTNFPSSFWTCTYSFRIRLQEKIAYILQIERIQIEGIKFERKQIPFLALFWQPSSSLCSVKLPTSFDDGYYAISLAIANHRKILNTKWGETNFIRCLIKKGQSCS